MGKPYSITDSDYQKLDNTINKKQIFYVKDISDKIEKVAFDVVRFKDEDDLSKLWVIQPSAEGDVIVALYDDGELEARSWKAIPDKQANINVFYKGEPVRKVVLASLGVPSEEVGVVCRTLTSKLNKDASMRKAFLLDLPVNERHELVNKYPELKE